MLELASTRVAVLQRRGIDVHDDLLTVAAGQFLRT